jgi:xanthine dehydrogenase YagR molybdenum-binding subunit
MSLKFDSPAGANPIDRQKVIGRSQDRIEGPLKVSGRARYAYERHDVAPDALYGWVVGATIAKGRIRHIDSRDAEAAPGVVAVVTAANAGAIKQAKVHPSMMLGGPQVEHYDQAIALVVAETLEQARDAAQRLHVDYAIEDGRFDLEESLPHARLAGPGFAGPVNNGTGDFDSAFATAAVQVDQRYTTPDESHQMMEPHATTAAWDGDSLTLWTSNQMIAWAVRDVAETFAMPPAKVRIVSPYVGGGFGAKLWIRSDAVLAALGARATGRPVKVALARWQLANNTVHRPATIQQVRLGADKDGLIDSIAHESWSGNLPGAGGENAAVQTRYLYRGEHRLIAHHLSELDLPEGNAMRAPGEAAGMLALEVAMDELAEKVGIDPVELRIRNDIQYDPEKGPSRPFSSRKFVECLKVGAERFHWSRRNPVPGKVRDGRWLVGMGMASAYRGNLLVPSGARVSVDRSGQVLVESDMTDIGTGSYTIIAQTAAEMMGVGIDRVEVRMGDSLYPATAGSGGQFGANCSTAGVYAACVALRRAVAQKAGFNAEDVDFVDGDIVSGNRRVKLGEAAGADGITAEDKIEFGDINKRFIQATFGAHFCEVGVDIHTGEVRVRRQGGAFAAGRILNPKAARSQVIGAMTMAVGAALMEELIVDKRFGYFVTRDLADYHVPVHADIPDQDVVFIDELDDKSSPMKAKGVGELGLCGAGAAVANAIYNATGIRVRDFPLTLDKLIEELPPLA